MIAAASSFPLTTPGLRQEIDAWNAAGCPPAAAPKITRAILSHIREHLFPSTDLRQELLRLESSTRYSDLAKFRRAADLLERAQSACVPGDGRGR